MFSSTNKKDRYEIYGYYGFQVQEIHRIGSWDTVLYADYSSTI